MIFDFGSRLQTAFGYISSNIAMRLIDQGFAEVANDSKGYNLAVYSSDANTRFDEVTLRRDYSGQKEEYIFAFKSISDNYTSVFATPPMLSLRRSKKLIVTPIDNSDIEVVERYGSGAWEITWRGLLIDMENHEFPIDKLESINKIFEANTLWSVDSEILNKVGVTALYVKDIAIDFVEGFEDTIAYTLTTAATKDLEYQLTN